MAPPRGSAVYKKKDGILALSKDSQSVSWTPTAPPGSKPALILAVSNITSEFTSVSIPVKRGILTNDSDLQQTPATNPKVALKIFVQNPGAKDLETHTFSFTSTSNPRSEADAIKDALSKVIQGAKAGTSLPIVPAGGSNAAMAIASAVSSIPGTGQNANAWYDDSSLISDKKLQESLLKANPLLMRTLVEASRLKPESISTSQFDKQFWSSRIHLLRAHAIEKNQTRGSYNVLSTIKPMTVDNALKLSVSKEQIQLIFNQHSLVKRVYDENVPKLSEEAFWSSFFQSRLFKKLKGEKISENDPTDPFLDKYLQHDDEAERAKRLMASHVPHIIDIEGNEENHSQRKGNQPDLTMRPTSADKVPIIRTLNTLSEKIMSHVAPNDIDPSEPIGVDEETFNSLALRDLQGDAAENRIILNIKDQSRFFSSDKESTISADALIYAKQNPTKVLSSLLTDLSKTTTTPFDLEAAIGVNEESSSDSEPESGKTPAKGQQQQPLSKRNNHVGSKSSLSAATSQVLTAIAEQRAQNDNDPSTSTSTTTFSTISNPLNKSHLSPAIFDRLSLTHATTTEFLHHFWLAFLSGDPTRADELANLVETLNRAMDRIKAVADDAEAERNAELDKVKQRIRDHYAQTQKKLRFDPEAVGGGRKVVNQLLGPTVNAIKVASGEYQKAWDQQGGAAAVAEGA
ncbi:RNA polymerase II transcription factor B subunit 1 [Bachmanniomyces sp. S44760]|nr:RNA polymerase II transcription factor B subunit 1 [Bachmanniomyces sp. S44760]